MRKVILAVTITLDGFAEDIDNLLIKLEIIKLVELPAGRTHLRFKFMEGLDG